MSTRKILVTGATGKQGGAVIKALLADPPPFEYQILALTRKSTSAPARSLASNPKVTLIEGSLEEPGSIFTLAGGVGAIWGVFCVTIPSFKKEAEDVEMKQGKDLVDAAIAHDVKHFVYTSVDRGGPDQSEVDATNVPHFFNVEKHLKTKARGTGMTYTILRPVAFMENLTPNLPGRVFTAVWATMGDKPLQLVSTKDIGIFAALAFKSSESDEYKNAAISIVGDELTQNQANEVFWRVMGRPMPRSYNFMATLLKKMVPELALMFQWFVDQGYRGDLQLCRRLNKDMLDFAGWLREESGFKR
ncbi:hypothetical protein A1O1_00023 [Capronia coronata CBS 617.96]|uniref:NmrA-like domain-containing protein n=1 Tax=Capronia coronata CBS 617.96 TaxID=1182541 RepID=W9YZ13_9EURO|nr:uncharacterized protein A1O1_00023 [Capronia coronata CBS 617.96]EXJ94905.1 hypothetical protein A1O1_00023 [Capronia coronata CBS 617.96]